MTKKNHPKILWSVVLSLGQASYGPTPAKATITNNHFCDNYYLYFSIHEKEHPKVTSASDLTI